MLDEPTSLRLRLTILPSNPLYTYLQQFTEKQYSGALLVLALQGLHHMTYPVCVGSGAGSLAEKTPAEPPHTPLAQSLPSDSEPDFGGLERLAQQMMADSKGSQHA
jgi:hypothetical protein